MRDPARIPEVLAQVQAFWEKNPDWRLGQVLLNVGAPQATCPELFYLEDDLLQARLRALNE